MDPASEWARVLEAVRRHEHGDLGHEEREESLGVSIALARSSVPGTLGCSITRLQEDGTFGTPASDGLLAIELDEVQYTAGDGPCLSAARRHRRERVDVMGDDARWPQLAGSALARGVHSSLSIPVGTGDRPAAINFYGSADGLYGSQGAQARAGLVAQVSGALLLTSGAPLETEPASLEKESGDRARIAAAQQLLMARQNLSSTMAYRRLAMRSGTELRSLADVAQRVLDGGR